MWVMSIKLPVISVNEMRMDAVMLLYVIRGFFLALALSLLVNM